MRWPRAGVQASWPSGPATWRCRDQARRQVLVAVLLALLASGSVSARPDAAPTTLRGTVTDAQDGTHLAGANVRLLGTVLGSITDRHGGFVLPRVPAGSYRLRVSMIGYADITVPVTLPAAAPVRVALPRSTIVLDPVVVTAQRRPQALQESSQSIAVLSAAQIEARTNLRLDDALEMVPGVHFVEDDINIRGATGYRANAGSRVLLLLDGVPVLASDTGGLSWDLVAMQDIEKVEVVKGAGSALYGSGAIGGVVNVITRRPSERGVLTVKTAAGLYDDPSEPEWVWAGDRTLGYLRTEVGYSKAVGPTAVRVSASRYASTGDRQDGDFDKWTVSARVHRQLDDASSLEVYAAWLRDRSSVFVQWRTPYLPDSTESGPPQLFHPLLTQERDNRLNLTWVNTYARYTRTLSARSFLRVRASLLRSMLGNQFDAGGAFSPAHGPGLEVQFDWVPAAGHFVTAGLEGKLDLVKGKFFLGAHRELSLAAFAQDEWRPHPQVRLTAGVRVDRHTVAAGATTDQVNPRLGVNWRPGSAWALRASAGSGFRTPTVAERSMRFKTNNFEVVPADHLEPERSWSYEVGLRRTLRASGYVDVAVFQNDYRDFIEPQVDLGRTASRIVVSFLNVADARIRGAEVAAGLRTWRQRLQLEGGLTLLEARDLGLDQALAYRPRVAVQFSPSVHLGRWHGRADYRYASRFERVAIYNSDQRVAQHELNLRLRMDVGPVTLTAGVNNALNYNFTQLERNLGEIRSFVVGLDGSF